MKRYYQIDIEPSGLRWDVPQKNQGQIVEIAYAHGPRAARKEYEAGYGATYQRMSDASDGSVKFYKRG